MTSAGPTILALETDSAWVVILAVSLVTLVVVGLLRRLIGRPGGLAAGLLLSLPLVLPLVAAFVYQQGVLPEVSVLQPPGSALTEGSGNLLHLLLVANDKGNGFTLYALSGSAGPWLLLFGALVSSFMLLRRLAGKIVVHRLVRRSEALDRREHMAILAATSRLSATAGLKSPPEILLLPEGAFGAFATGGRPKILISRDLVAGLEAQELEAVIAHEIAHIKAHDVQVVATAGFLKDVVAWNPFAHLAYRTLSRNRELEADRRAAELTGDPLAVASGLVKMCELMRGRSLGRRAALAFLRPGSSVRRRVSALLEVSGGGLAVARPSAPLRYAFACLLAGVLGLQVGAHLTDGGSSGFAVIFGSPSAEQTQPWAGVGSLEPRLIGGHHGAHKEKAGPREGRDFPFSGRTVSAYRESVFSVRTKQLSTWKATMRQLARRQGIPPPSLFSKTSADIRAIPLMSEGSRFGVYRIRSTGF